jgi:hypothetical protein
MMSMRTAFSVVFFLVLLALALHPANGASRGEGRSACDLINDWVAAHQDNLPRTYEDLSRYPLPYRRGIFNALTAEEKSELWKDHLANMLEEASLTDAQRALIWEAIDLVTPDLYSRSQRRVGFLERKTETFQQKALKEFNRALLSRVFGQLEPADVELVSLGKEVMISGGVACSCNHDHDFCPSGYGCDEKSICDRLSSGCGWVWSQACDGLCKDPSGTVLTTTTN